MKALLVLLLALCLSVAVLAKHSDNARRHRPQDSRDDKARTHLIREPHSGAPDSTCLGFTSCVTCIEAANCGWCLETTKCALGTISGPDQGECQNWDWTNCTGSGPPPPPQRPPPPPPPPPPPVNHFYRVNFEYTGVQNCQGINRTGCWDAHVDSYCCNTQDCWESNSTMAFTDATPAPFTPVSLTLKIFGHLQCGNGYYDDAGESRVNAAEFSSAASLKHRTILHRRFQQAQIQAAQPLHRGGKANYGYGGGDDSGGGDDDSGGTGTGYGGDDDDDDDDSGGTGTGYGGDDDSGGDDDTGYGSSGYSSSGYTGYSSSGYSSSGYSSSGYSSSGYTGYSSSGYSSSGYPPPPPYGYPPPPPYGYPPPPPYGYPPPPPYGYPPPPYGYPPPPPPPHIPPPPPPPYNTGNTTFGLVLNGNSLGTEFYYGDYDCSCEPVMEPCKTVTFNYSIVSSTFRTRGKNVFYLSVPGGSACLRNALLTVNYN